MKNNNFLLVTNKNKSIHLALLSLLISLFLISKTNSVVELNPEIKVELLNYEMESFDPVEYLDFAQGTWRKVVNPSDCAGRIYEFTPTTAGYIKIGNNHYNYLGPNHVYVIYNSTKTPQIDLSCGYYGKEMEDAVLEDVLNFMQSQLNSGNSYVLQINNQLPYMTLGLKYGNKPELFRDIMQKIDKTMFPGGQNVDLKSLFPAFDVNSEQIKYFVENNLHNLAYAIYNNSTDPLTIRKYYNVHPDNIAFTKNKNVLKKMKEAYRANDTCVASMMKIIQLTIYFLEKNLRTVIFNDQYFLTEFFNLKKTKPLLELLAISFGNNGVLEKKANTLEVMKNLEVEKWDNTGFDHDENYMENVQKELYTNLKILVDELKEVVLTESGSDKSVDDIDFLNEYSEDLVFKFVIASPDFLRVSIQNKFILMFHKAFSYDLPDYSTEKITSLEVEENVMHMEQLLYVNGMVRLGLFNASKFKYVEYEFFKQKDRLLLI
jgi:hypothetical protein